MTIKIHSNDDFTSMHKAGSLAAQTLDYITQYVEAGVTTDHLNKLCHEFIIKNGAIPAPLNYKGFPKSVCISVNDVICHGIPSDYRLKNGDILNIDVTTIVDGWHGDTSRMYVVGEVSKQASELIQFTYDCMMDAITNIKAGDRVGKIGNIIYNKVALHNKNTHVKNRYAIVDMYGGHGIGKVFHDEPFIPHNSHYNSGPKLVPGMFFTIEPMINIESPDTILDSQDQWTVRTKNGKLSAQFEHTVGVTENSIVIFTESPKKQHYPPYH